jgi:hypothetical protein
MRRCPNCGAEIDAFTLLCRHHHEGVAAGWSLVNRLMCDLVHRHIVPPRPPDTDAEPAWPTADVA